MSLYRHTTTGEIRDLDTIPEHKAHLWEPYTPPEPLPSVPGEVDMAAARIVLLRSGITDETVRTAIAALPDEQQRAEALILWEFRTTIRRDSQLVAALGPALGLTGAQIDAMFVAAQAV